MEAITVIGSGELQATRPITEELSKKWTDFIDATDKTVETYNRAMKQFIHYLNMNGISQPQREDVVAYREYLKIEHKPTTVQSYTQAVKLFFKWTAAEGIYPDVASRVKGVKLTTDHKKDYLTTKQVVRLLSGVDRSTLNGKRDYAVLALMATTGLRTIEVSRADIEDLRTVADSTALYVQGKGREDKTEYVKVPEVVENAIREYLKARGEKDGKSTLFASLAHRNYGKRLTTRSISRIVKEHLVGVGLESDRLTAHSLRHTAATLNLLNGGSIEETAQMLRHRNTNTTLTYSHALERATNNSEDRVAHAIFG